MKKIVFSTVLIIIACIVFMGCGAESKYKRKNSKIYYISYAGPLPMFGLNWEKHEEEVPDADISTFIDLKCKTYAKDKNNVYFNGKITNKFDVSTFEILSEDYAKDRNYVYNISVSAGGSILKGADPVTFVVIGKKSGKDAYHYFDDWKMVDEIPNKK